MIKLVVAGAAGRMGSMVLDVAKYDPKVKVIYGLESFPETLKGETEKFGSDTSRIAQADVVIDFTTPNSTLDIAAQVAKYKKRFVICTTGFSPVQEKRLKKILKSVPVLKSANMSIGVNLLFMMAAKTAQVLTNFDVRIDETHHIHKKDKPSGTALQVGRLMEPYLQKKIDYDSKREGEVIGDHCVTFSGDLETIKISHHAKSRAIFAMGAIRAAKWLMRQKPGFYTMQDALGLK